MDDDYHGNGELCKKKWSPGRLCRCCDDSSESKPTTTTIRLFGVDITVNQNHRCHDHSLQSHLHNKPINTIRLFGVDIAVNQNHDNSDTNSPTSTSREYAITDIDTENPSRKRKWRNPNQQEEQEIKEEEEEEKEEEEAAAEEEEAAAAAEEEVPPPLFHPRILEGIQQHPILSFKKNLQNSDVARGQNRLLIPETEVVQLMGALTEEERNKLEMIKEDNRPDFLSVVTTTVRDGVEYALHLKKWRGSGSVVLIHEWSKLVKANGLQKGDEVHGWGYRLGHQFRLALNIIKK